MLKYLIKEDCSYLKKYLLFSVTFLPKDQQIIDSLSRIKKLPIEVWAVKLADRITNLQPPPSYWTTEKRKKYLDQAKLIGSVNIPGIKQRAFQNKKVHSTDR